MNSYYGYKVVGVYQTLEECAEDPIAVANKLVPGDFKYEDVNGDKRKLMVMTAKYLALTYLILHTALILV